MQPAGYLWILPALVVSVGFLYYCIGYTGYISTLDWDGSNPDREQVGFDNFIAMLGDPILWGALSHTVIFLVVTFSIQTALGIGFAALLHSRVRLGVGYKIIIFVPVVLAPAVTAPVFRQLFAADGQFNWILDHIGLGFLSHPWLADSSTALGVIMFVQIWHWTGLTFILYFAAMSQVDTSTLEAARIDGAGNLRTLISIVLPEVRGTTVALLMLSTIGALKLFDAPYLVTKGGPNYSTEFLGTYIYRNAIFLGEVGYAAALSVVLLVLAIGSAILFNLLNRRRANA